MSKNKEDVDNLRKKLFDKKKELQVAESTKKLDERLGSTAYTIVQNPDKRGRNYLIVKFKYDVKTKQCAIVGVKNFRDTAAGMSFIMNLNNLETLYNKNKGEGE